MNTKQEYLKISLLIGDIQTRHSEGQIPEFRTDTISQ